MNRKSTGSENKFQYSVNLRTFCVCDNSNVALSRVILNNWTFCGKFYATVAVIVPALDTELWPECVFTHRAPAVM